MVIGQGFRLWCVRQTSRKQHGASGVQSGEADMQAAAPQASFGPFYRIEQLILSTVPRSRGSHVTRAQPEPLPPIVTDANIRLLFAMQAQVLLSGTALGISMQG